MLREDAETGQGCGVPDNDAPVLAACDDEFAILGGGDGKDCVDVALVGVIFALTPVAADEEDLFGFALWWGRWFLGFPLSFLGEPLLRREILDPPFG